MKSPDIRFGCAYYPEQDPPSEWARDAALMRDLGLNTVRVGEFCWSRMQTESGEFTLDWLEEVVAILADHGIQTILCTPTAAPPAYLVDRYPDLPCVTPTGKRGLFGGRRHYSVFHEGYRRDCAAVAKALGERFGPNENVVGWQLDNEVGSYSMIDCSEPARRAFQHWCEKQYGNVETLNREWGMIFWNQEISRFDQLPAPTEMMGTRNPQMLLAYNRFCIEGMAEFLLIQAEALRQHADPEQFVLASALEPIQQVILQKQEANPLIDGVSLHRYPELRPEAGATEMKLAGARAIAGDLPLHVMEQQIGSGHTTTGGLRDDIRRLWCWQSLALGSQSILWFHWRRFRSGCEWRHTSIVERDRKPRRIFRHLKRTIAEMVDAGSLLRGLTPLPDVQILSSLDERLAFDRSNRESFWMEIQLPEALGNRGQLYLRELRDTVFVPLLRGGLTPGIVHPLQKLDTSAPLIITSLDLYTPQIEAWLRDFCESGGRAFLYPGAGERNIHGAQGEAPPPGGYSDLAGVELLDYVPLDLHMGQAFDHQAGRASASTSRHPTQIEVGLSNEILPFDIRHSEILALTTAKPIATYTGGIAAGKPAIARNAVGQGTLAYLGAVPSETGTAVRLWRLLLPDLMGKSRPYQRWRNRSEAGPLSFYFNPTGREVTLEHPLHDELTEADMKALPPYGVALVKD